MRNRLLATAFEVRLECSCSEQRLVLYALKGVFPAGKTGGPEGKGGTQGGEEKKQKNRRKKKKAHPVERCIPGLTRQPLREKERERDDRRGGG